MSVGIAMKSSIRVSVILGIMTNVTLQMSSSPPRRVTSVVSLVIFPNHSPSFLTYDRTLTHRCQS